MAPKPAMPGSAQTSAHFTTFARGAIYGLHIAGWALEEIAAEVPKADGSVASQQAVRATIARVKAQGGYLSTGGVALHAAGRPRATPGTLDKQIRRVVFRHRGRAMVTPKFIRKVLPAARRVSLRTIRRRLGEAGLAWLRRRRKTLVPAEHRSSRVRWAEWVLKRRRTSLARWVYTDGTVFYLARSAAEADSKRRAALGPFVWRQANGSDALYADCVGPSTYAKGQGQPVRIWGILAKGRLCIYVLPAGQVMNRWWYEWVIRSRFAPWLAEACGTGAGGHFLLQDHERCLWAEEPRKAMRDTNLSLLENYPKCSADLNPIETAWREVRARLADTEPTSFELRAAFLRRLRQAVRWCNTHRASVFNHLCDSAQERAAAVLAAKPPGARTQF